MIFAVHKVVDLLNTFGQGDKEKRAFFYLGLYLKYKASWKLEYVMRTRCEVSYI